MRYGRCFYLSYGVWLHRQLEDKKYKYEIGKVKDVIKDGFMTHWVEVNGKPVQFAGHKGKCKAVND